MAIAQHDIARLKIAMEKIFAAGAEQEIGATIEITFECVFIEGNAGKAKKIILEIVQSPGDGLAIEAGDGITDAVVQISRSFHLEAREDGNDFAVGFDDSRSNVIARAVFAEKFKE